MFHYNHEAQKNTFMPLFELQQQQKQHKHNYENKKCHDFFLFIGET